MHAHPPPLTPLLMEQVSHSGVCLRRQTDALTPSFREAPPLNAHLSTAFPSSPETYFVHRVERAPALL